jgi:peptidoglycan L-alanyl-D-glutamate endopeptidase CwlK
MKNIISLFLICVFLLFSCIICIPETIDKDLLTVIRHTQKQCEYKIVCLYRGEEEQNKLYIKGLTKLKYPMSKHNQIPVKAMDIIPKKYNNNPYDRITDFYWIAGCIYAESEKLYDDGEISHHIRWGGDWNMNNVFYDNKFNDLSHFELYP